VPIDQPALLPVPFNLGRLSGFFRQSDGDIFGRDAEQRADNDRNDRR
jgi:hypothetical protein